MGATKQQYLDQEWELIVSAFKNDEVETIDDFDEKLQQKGVFKECHDLFTLWNLLNHSFSN